MKVVIIGQNEGSSIEMMLSSLLHLDADRIWIADRCSDDTVEKLTRYEEKVIQTEPNLRGRQTSYSRNLGLSFCDGDDVLFLDGDRYVVSGDLNFLNSWDKDICLLPIQNDFRLNIDFEAYYGRIHNAFYSCGVFFKKETLSKILKFQNGELFRKDIQTAWGIEDVYLGDVCYHLGLTCDINKNIILHGKFENIHVGVDNMRKRFHLREKLNVRW